LSFSWSRQAVNATQHNALLQLKTLSGRPNRVYKSLADVKVKSNKKVKNQIAASISEIYKKKNWEMCDLSFHGRPSVVSFLVYLLIWTGAAPS
jgi:hypothetical protein